MSDVFWVAMAIMVSFAFLAVSHIVSAYRSAKSIDRSFDALREDRKWLAERFLEILEPRFIETRQRLDAIDHELSLQEEAQEIERY